MNDVDIKHEFEAIVSSIVEDESTEKCDGFRLRLGGEVVGGNDLNCNNKVQLRAVRSCCGVIQSYCLDCYNQVVKFLDNDDSRHFFTPTDSHHNPLPIFSQIHFI